LVSVLSRGIHSRGLTIDQPPCSPHAPRDRSGPKDQLLGAHEKRRVLALQRCPRVFIRVDRERRTISAIGSLWIYNAFRGTRPLTLSCGLAVNSTPGPVPVEPGPWRRHPTRLIPRLGLFDSPQPHGPQDTVSLSRNTGCKSVLCSLEGSLVDPQLQGPHPTTPQMVWVPFNKCPAHQGLSFSLTHRFHDWAACAHQINSR